MFQHILVPTDGSEVSFVAVPYALRLARREAGTITMLNAHEEFLDAEERQFLRVSSERFREMMKERALQARRDIEGRLARFEIDVPLTIEIREGHPKQEICRVAKEVGADTIVLASRGHSSLGAFILGSVAEHVVRHSKLPVLVVKESAP
ncbi:MAG: putative universal stress protein [Calditrichaeota bacterium]|nr:putative universal stress protein [Calditrichota bacterium]